MARVQARPTDDALRQDALSFIPLLLLPLGLFDNEQLHAREFLLVFVMSSFIATKALFWFIVRQDKTEQGQSADWAIYVFAGIYAILFSVLTVLRHEAFNSGALDLGMMDQIIWNSLNGRLFDSSILGYNFLGEHFSPILPLFAPVYLLWSDVRALLILQAILLASAALPLYWLARDELRNRLVALAFAVSFLLAPLLHRANLFDFHPDKLEPVLILLAFYSLYRKRTLAYGIFLGLLLLTKEDGAIWAIAMGLYSLGQDAKDGWA